MIGRTLKELHHEQEEIIEKTKNLVMDMLKKTIRPEFLNRIDDIILFAPLKESEIEQIVRIQLGGVRKMLAETASNCNIRKKH